MSKLTAQELRDKGFVEVSPGDWRRPQGTVHERVMKAVDADVQAHRKLLAPKKRIRQSTKPILNKLEREWFDKLVLQAIQCGLPRPHAQAFTVRLANGVRYTPDCFHFDWPSFGEPNRPTAWEVKGPWMTDDAVCKVKMFATAYPEIRVIMVWRDKGGIWQEQRILP